MRITILLALSTLLFHSGLAQQKPKIVIGVVVDQMRHDYLQRFDSKYSEGGFKRLMREGFEARNTHYDYVPTKTGPGHASVYTGTTPKYHGIIANDWYVRELGHTINCVEDPSTINVGGTKGFGMVSPINLTATTITDELLLTTNFKSKVIGISIKDRGAVLPAGHRPNGAYWFDLNNGEFMTSTYFTTKLPDWVVAFNKRKLADEYLNKTWNTLLPIESYTESSPDNNPYERIYQGKSTPTFPYNLKELKKYESYQLIKSTPFGNSILIDLAKAAIEAEKLGSGPATDFLAISFSSPDAVGHDFGPRSIEVEDTYLRLDRELADFLVYLDNQFGAGNYLLFLTSDHAVVENPQLLMENKLPGGYYIRADEKKALAEGLNKQFGEGDWVLNTSNDQVFLNRNLIVQKGLDLSDVQQVCAGIIKEFDSVLDVLTGTNLASTDYSDPTRQALQRGYNTKLSGDLLILRKPSYLSDGYDKRGTDHGTPYTYDTHVPLLFFGTGVKPGSTVRKISITDVAPTVSFLLDISLPNACIGQPITEVFE